MISTNNPYFWNGTVISNKRNLHRGVRFHLLALRREKKMKFLIVAILGAAWLATMASCGHKAHVPPMTIGSVDANDLRRHHITFFTTDLQGTLDFWSGLLNYQVAMDVTLDGAIVGFPCTFRDILLQRSPEDVLDIIELSDCTEGFVPPPPGIHHIGYFVTDAAQMVIDMTDLDITVLFPAIAVAEFGVEEACFLSDENIMFCGTSWIPATLQARELAQASLRSEVATLVPDWLDALDFRYHHFTFFTQDLKSTINFWHHDLGYYPMMDETIDGSVIGFPCQFRDILLGRGAQDVLDIIELSNCPTDYQQPPEGVHHIGYFVNDIESFHARMVDANVVVLFPPMEALGLYESCYLSPDSIMFCVGQWAA
jgi:catechol 2,3-dioxygenase-like lactoylglutathione lyase family enzyme